MFIPEITTRVHVEVDTSELDNAINLVEGESILSELGLTEVLEEAKSSLNNLKEPLTDAVADRLKDNQENIISSKHYITGMMSQSVDKMSDGEDILVGDTASSVDGFPYPLAIEKGTKSHWVAPNTFHALHWTDSGGEYWSRGHMVSGIKADPFVEPSIQDTLDDIDKILEGFDI